MDGWQNMSVETDQIPFFVNYMDESACSVATENCYLTQIRMYNIIAFILTNYYNVVYLESYANVIYI